MKCLSIALVVVLAAHAELVRAEVVVLRNGNVLVGQSDLLGTQIVVNTGTAEVRLDRRDIEDITPTMVAAYERKRARLPHPTAGQHLALAEWCMRNDLWPQAALELNDARLRDARHPGLPILEARFRVAYEAQQRVVAEPQAATAAPEPPAADLAELDQLAATTDPKVVEQFTRQIQPLLANNCTTAGCHNEGSGRPFELTRDVIHNTASRRSTLRNLREALEQVNQADPAASPLVTLPAAAHGSLDGPVFTGRRAKLLDKLTDWTYLAAGVPRQEVAAVQPVVEEAAVETPNEVVPASAELEVLTAEEPVDAAAHFWERQPAASPQVKSAPAQPGRDEFDPAIFNQRYGTAATESETELESTAESPR